MLIMPQTTENNAERLAAGQSSKIVDSGSEAAFDTICELMTEVFDIPIACITVKEQGWVFHKCHEEEGNAESGAAIESLCNLAMHRQSCLIVEDISGWQEVSENPLVSSDKGIQFYAGAPLITATGENVGAVCVADTKGRRFTERQEKQLVRFAQMAVHEIESRLTTQEYQSATQELCKKSDELHRLYEELQFVTDTMPQLVWATDAAGYSFFFNKGWMEYTGLSFEEVKGDGWTKSLHPDDLERSFAAWRRAVETGESYDVEYRLRRHDGVYHWFVARGTPMKDEAGNILKWYGTSTDIDDQKQAEQSLERKVEARTMEVLEAQLQLRQSNQTIEDIMARAPIGIVVYTSVRDEHGVITDFRPQFFNEMSNTLTGVTLQQREDFSLRKLFGRSDTHIFFENYVDVVEKGAPINWEQFVPRTGKWLSVTVTKLGDGFLRTLTDVTELKQSQQALEQESLFVNGMLNASINAVMALDAIRDDEGNVTDFRIVRVNDAFMESAGITESIIGKQYKSLFPDGSLSDGFNYYLQVLSTGVPVRKEIYSAGLNLNSWFDLSIVKRSEEGVVVTFANISHQREAALHIEEQKRLLDNIMKFSPSGISVTEFIRDSEGKIVDGRTILANEVASHHVGAPVHESINLKFSEHNPELLASPLFQMGVRASETGEPFITQFYIELTDRWIELSVSRMDEDHLINLFADITPIKQAQLRMEEYLEELKRKNEEMEQFTYVSHHDLQEPVRKILIFSDMLRAAEQESLKPSSLDKLERINAAARRMTGALRDILNYASLSKEEQPIRVYLSEVVTSVQSDLELLIAEKGAEFRLSELPAVQAVPYQMHQLFYNLLNNALKFSVEGRTPIVSICSRPLDPASLAEHPELNAAKVYHHIQVMDNGIGFEPANAAKIFGIFQRLHTKEAYPGTGIGLALCKKVVQNHGGKIWADSKTGEGATFHIILPVA
jgi:PAS domain S-box-containing protein